MNKQFVLIASLPSHYKRKDSTKMAHTLRIVRRNFSVSSCDGSESSDNTSSQASSICLQDTAINQCEVSLPISLLFLALWVFTCSMLILLLHILAGMRPSSSVSVVFMD